MGHGLWDKRLAASTRGRILDLLRRANRTVDELAQILELTDNAIRAHLATLERDGLIQQRGSRRGTAKPAILYELTPQAEHLYPKAYSLIFSHLLDTVKEDMTPEEVEEIMQKTGERLAASWNAPRKGLSQQLQSAVALLNELGGLAELEQEGESYVLRGYRCPLATMVSSHPEMCRLIGIILSEIIDAPIEVRCSQEERPCCCFFVYPPRWIDKSHP